MKPLDNHAINQIVHHIRPQQTDYFFLRIGTQPMLASLFVKIPGDKGKQGHVKGVVGHQSPDVQITVIEMPVHHKKHTQGRQDAELHIEPRIGLPLRHLCSPVPAGPGRIKSSFCHVRPPSYTFS